MGTVCALGTLVLYGAKDSNLQYRPRVIFQKNQNRQWHYDQNRKIKLQSSGLYNFSMAEDYPEMDIVCSLKHSARLRAITTIRQKWKSFTTKNISNISGKIIFSPWVSFSRCCKWRERHFKELVHSFYVLHKIKEFLFEYFNSMLQHSSIVGLSMCNEVQLFLHRRPHSRKYQLWINLNNNITKATALSIALMNKFQQWGIYRWTHIWHIFHHQHLINFSLKKFTLLNFAKIKGLRKWDLRFLQHCWWRLTLWDMTLHQQLPTVQMTWYHIPRETHLEKI